MSFWKISTGSSLYCLITGKMYLKFLKTGCRTNIWLHKSIFNHQLKPLLFLLTIGPVKPNKIHKQAWGILPLDGFKCKFFLLQAICTQLIGMLQQYLLSTLVNTKTVRCETEYLEKLLCNSPIFNGKLSDSSTSELKTMHNKCSASNESWTPYFWIFCSLMNKKCMKLWFITTAEVFVSWNFHQWAKPVKFHPLHALKIYFFNRNVLVNWQKKKKMKISTTQKLKTPKFPPMNISVFTVF